ncbi:MAG: hypothetical protein EPO68_04910 [Planctomycetota bacterium]|nr:MAG: hypothetical protein EPO68_04910 [Planctomycetota bacterium]
MHPNGKSSLASPALVLALLAAPALAADLVVGVPGSGAPFTSIQAAINAAQPGDRVLVSAGTYDEAVLVAKPIELIGGFGGPTIVRGTNPAPFSAPTPLVVRDIAAGARARVANFTVTPLPHVLQFPPSSAFYADDCAGRIEISNLKLSVLATLNYQLGSTPAIAYVSDCAQVFVTSLVASGAAAPFIAQGGQGHHALFLLRSNATLHDSVCAGGVREWGGDGLRVVDSVVAASRCRFTGAAGTGLSGTTGQGGAGIRATTSQLRIAGGQPNTLRGGDALTGLVFGAGLGTAGAGIECDATSAIEHAADVEPLGGTAAGAFPAGPAVNSAGGTVTALARRLPVLAFEPALGTPGAPLAVHVYGEPNAKVLRYLSLATGPQFSLAGFNGSVMLDLSTLVVLPGTLLDANGTGVVNGTVPSDPAFAGAQFLEQGLQVLPSALDISVPAQITVST